MSSYEPRFDLDFARGMVGEKLVGSFLEALSGSKIEVKTDHRVLETGNVFVETHQQVLGQEWKPSGINVSTAEFYCFAGPSGYGFVTIRTDLLKELAGASPRANVTTLSADSSAARGRIVKMNDILELIYLGTNKK
jgi:hypothetical protein